MCISNGHNPLIMFRYFCHKMNVVIFAAKINRYWVSCVGISSYSFMLIALKHNRCLGHGLKMCISNGHNPLIMFRHFCHKMNVVIFAAKINRYWVSCVGISSYSFMLIALKHYRCLGHGQKMCISNGHNPHIILSLF